jgi:hypothetical protein
MSGYQYYEFLAIDHQLTEEEMGHMRMISSRGHITPVSFSNAYHWGDFKANPEDLMRRFYDAHVYVANWGTAIFMLRLPLCAFDAKVAQSFVVEDSLEMDETPTHWICTWSLSETEDYESFGEEDGPGWMMRLAAIREELLRGDLRSLYIGWLAGVSQGMDEGEREPTMPEGLAPYTAAQQALAEFLGLNVDLFVGSGTDRPITQSELEEEVTSWLKVITLEEMRPLVQKLAMGQGQEAEREVKNRFSTWRRHLDKIHPSVPQRTVADLWELAEKAKEARLQVETNCREQAEEKRLKARTDYLTALATDFTKAWQAVNQRVQVGSGKAYDEACQSLIDLAEAYVEHASQQAFDAELRRFMAGHGQRKSLVQRLVKARLLRSA